MDRIVDGWSPVSERITLQRRTKKKIPSFTSVSDPHSEMRALWDTCGWRALYDDTKSTGASCSSARFEKGRRGGWYDKTVWWRNCKNEDNLQLWSPVKPNSCGRGAGQQRSSAPVEPAGEGERHRRYTITSMDDSVGVRRSRFHLEPFHGWSESLSRKEKEKLMVADREKPTGDTPRLLRETK